jgi:hypothetical protein
MKPVRRPAYLQWILTLFGVSHYPDCRGYTYRAARIGPEALGLVRDSLCAKHHRTGADSYHRLGPRKFSEVHHLNIPALVARLSAKPIIRVEVGMFVSRFWRSGVPVGIDGSGLGPGDPQDERTTAGDPGESQAEPVRENIDAVLLTAAHSLGTSATKGQSFRLSSPVETKLRTKPVRKRLWRKEP